MPGILNAVRPAGVHGRRVSGDRQGGNQPVLVLSNRPFRRGVMCAVVLIRNLDLGGRSVLEVLADDFGQAFALGAEFCEDAGDTVVRDWGEVEVCAASVSGHSCLCY